MGKHYSSGNPPAEPVSEPSTERARTVLADMCEPEGCMYETHHATWWEPADYCENDAEPDEMYCADHRESDN
jgi:hypothetical protein